MNQTIDAATAAYMDRIRHAYLRVLAYDGRRPGDRWVSLTELRPEVGGYREQVDAALLALHREPDVSIIPTSAQWTLTPADRDAAVRIGNQDKHWIAIH